MGAELIYVAKLVIFCSNRYGNTGVMVTLKNSSCTAKIQCVQEHFSYCPATHLRSLDGTLIGGH
jgi:hypothetical protein